MNINFPILSSKKIINVLVIDDDHSIRNTIQTLLRTKNVVCHEKVSGSVDIIRKMDPHVILLDYSLEDGTAFDILNSYNFRTKRNIPLIYSGFPIPEPVKSQLYMLGVMNVIIKPSTISTIESIIENYYEISLKYRS
jgi:DNA-binding NtrC family response regulator